LLRHVAAPVAGFARRRPSNTTPAPAPAPADQISHRTP
jgi:hypothetical protein